MKKYLFSLVLLFPLVLLPLPDPAGTDTDPAPSFQQEVFPIIEKKCNTGDCHGQEGTAFPKYRTYLMIRAKSKKMIKRIFDEKKPMPPADSGLTLEKAEIAILQSWVEAGMPEN